MMLPSVAIAPLKEPDNDAPALIDHYFTQICKIAGCFDSALNPFRIFAKSMMQYSKPVYLLLQASSAAHLSRKDPAMRIKAISLQSEAFSAVREDIGKLQTDYTQSIVTDELMLTSIIAGLTSAWYDVNDVGQSHVLGGQVLLYLWLNPQRQRLQYQQTFIIGCFVYWLHISAFVVGDPHESFHYQTALQETVESLDMSCDIEDDSHVPKAQRRIIPHPLTGFSMKLLLVIGKVGSLCRIAQSGLPLESGATLEDEAWNLEQELLSHAPSPAPTTFTDPQDPTTSIAEILRVGEANRCAGLLQLYTQFPSLLQRHARHPAETFEASFGREMEAVRLNTLGLYTPEQHNWLRGLAFHICGLLDDIPKASPTRVLQGLVVLIASAWLIEPLPSDFGKEKAFEHPQFDGGNGAGGGDGGWGGDVQKEYWREKVGQGLRFHGEYVGLEQVSRVLDIVQEGWRRNDEGGGKGGWMAVVAEKGLQTLYG